MQIELKYWQYIDFMNKKQAKIFNFHHDETYLDSLDGVDRSPITKHKIANHVFFGYIEITKMKTKEGKYANMAIK